MRLLAQDEELRRQFEHWVSPIQLQTADSRKSDPLQRQGAFAREHLRRRLRDAAFETARMQVVYDSATWVTKETLDDYITYALENPQGLYAPQRSSVGAVNVYECIAGIDPQQWSEDTDANSTDAGDETSL